MPHFLVDASLPRPTADVIRNLGYFATDVRDIGLRHAPDHQIARYALDQRLCLITRDFDFADIRQYPPGQYAGIVVLETPDGANRNMVLGLVERFLHQQETVNRLPGRLAIINLFSVRMRE